jgi:hypothetical protein
MDATTGTGRRDAAGLQGDAGAVPGSGVAGGRQGSGRGADHGRSAWPGPCGSAPCARGTRLSFVFEEANSATHSVAKSDIDSVGSTPIWFQAGSANLALRVGNNPTNAIDPSGLVVIILPGAFDKGDDWAPEFAKQLRLGWAELKPAPAPVQRIYRFYHDKQDTENSRIGGSTANVPLALRVNLMRELVDDLQRLLVKLHTGLEKEKEPIYLVAHSQGNLSAVAGLGNFDKLEGIKPGSGRVAGLLQMSSSWADRTYTDKDRTEQISGSLVSGAAAWAPNATVYVAHWPFNGAFSREYTFGDALVEWERDGVGPKSATRLKFPPKIQPVVLTDDPTGKKVYNAANGDMKKLHSGSHDPSLAKDLYAKYLVAPGKSLVTNDQWDEIAKWAKANLKNSTLKEE